MMKWFRPGGGFLCLAIAVVGITAGAARGDEPPSSASPPAAASQYGHPQKLTTLANPAIRESSGLAASHRHSGVLWTHNDSGDEPRLYAFDLQGRDLGSCLLDGVVAFDWEDLASFIHAGRPYLLVADVGNNGHAAAVHMLHLVAEPDIRPAGDVRGRHVAVDQTIHFSYGDEPRNCEAVAVDPTDRTILLVTKELLGPAGVYAFPWPQSQTERALVARRIGTLSILGVTSLDVSSDGRRAIALTYLHAYEYRRGDNETWTQAFAKTPRQILMPPREQGEAICYGRDGRSLYLTSEKTPTPLWVVPPK
jgi:hypothetical protein